MISQTMGYSEKTNNFFYSENKSNSAPTIGKYSIQSVNGWTGDYNGSTTTFVYRAENTNGGTGISHMALLSFCTNSLMTQSVASVGNYTSNNGTYNDSSIQGSTWDNNDPPTASCQAGAQEILKINGVTGGNDKYTFFKLVLNGNYTAVNGKITYKVGTPPGTGAPACYVLETNDIKLPKKITGTISGSGPICVNATTTFSTNLSGGTWSSSNTSVAEVNSSGVITGKGIGTSTITYTVGGNCGESVSKDISVIGAPSINVTDAERCGPGSVTLSASTDAGGVIDWFNASSGGNSLHTGTTYSTSTTATFYVQSSLNGCTSERKSVVGTIYKHPNCCFYYS
ncbi:Ig-like domain-containing protein [Sandaracinomonas limnophila]|nr:Ig-like domain-containing protein [Sandaracinomonas limnophila]